MLKAENQNLREYEKCARLAQMLFELDATEKMSRFYEGMAD